MIGEKITDKKSLIGALADALDMVSDESDVFVDLTGQTVEILVPTIVSGESNAHLNGHEIVWMEKASSREGFEIMQDFAARCEGEERQRLARALSARRPFRAFKDALAELGLCDNYYILKDAAYLDLAEARLQDADIDFVDGRIVCTQPRNISVFECEDDEEGL